MLTSAIISAVLSPTDVDNIMHTLVKCKALQCKHSAQTGEFFREALAWVELSSMLLQEMFIMILTEHSNRTTPLVQQSEACTPIQIP